MVDRRTALKAAAVSLLPGAVLTRVEPAGADAPRTLVAAGDMNHVDETRRTGALAVAQHPDVVTTLGDQQYPTGSLEDYRQHYDSSPWGDLKRITRPVPGHHEYDTPGAAGYFAYFGVRPYYAYDIGLGWRGYALNSHIDIQEQVRWLRRELAAHPGAHVVASWSDPRYSSGTRHGSDPLMQPFWNALTGRKGVVLNGHEHNYERFAERGRIRAFTAGTGGLANYPFGAPAPGSAVRITGVPGILVLRLQQGGAYSWAFKDLSARVLDRGSG